MEKEQCINIYSPVDRFFFADCLTYTEIDRIGALLDNKSVRELRSIAVDPDACGWIRFYAIKRLDKNDSVAEAATAQLVNDRNCSPIVRARALAHGRLPDDAMLALAVAIMVDTTERLELRRFVALEFWSDCLTVGRQVGSHLAARIVSNPHEDPLFCQELAYTFMDL